MEIELIEMLAGFAMGVLSAATVARHRVSALLPSRSLFTRATGQEDK